MMEAVDGEAVAIGVALDCLYSTMMHGLPEADAQRVIDCLLRLGFQLDHPVLEDPQALRVGLEEFRQHLGGRLTVTMLRGIGSPLDVHEVDWPAMEASIQRLTQSVASH